MAPNTLKWRDEPVYDLEGTTRNFEQLRTLLQPGTLHGEALKGGLTGELPEPSLAKPEAWKLISALGFEHEWVAFGAGRPVPEYRKNPFGIVELRGTLKAGKVTESAFTLPAGYRPKEGVRDFIVEASATVVGIIRVESTGAVVPFNSGASEAKAYIYLEPVFFSVE